MTSSGESVCNREYAIRIGMSIAEGAELSALLPRTPADVQERVHDQLWLMAVLNEQRRRTNIAERAKFDERANKILEALDP